MSLRRVPLLLLALLGAAGTAAAAATEAEPLPRPLTLTAALDYAAAHNPTLRRVREQVAEREGVLVTARAGRLPSLTLGASASHTDEALIEQPLDDDAWQVDLTVTQTLYAGGAVQAGVRSGEARVRAAEATVLSTLADTLLDVREGFYAVLLAREQIAVQEEAIQVLEAELVRARDRREAGVGSDFDVLRAEVAVANARPGLIRARNAWRVSQDRLRASLGTVPLDAGAPTDLGVAGSLAVPPLALDLGDAILAARARRPELLAQEHAISAAEHDIDSARAGRRPQVTASAGYETKKTSLNSSWHDTLDGWEAGVRASWAIFDGRATSGRVRQARSRLTQAQLAEEELRLSIEVEVRQAHSSLTEAHELLVASEKVVEQAQESLRLARARLEAGSATQLDVLTAQSALTEARSNHASAQHDYAVAVAQLRRAMGASGAS